jgi:hypothetical protein
VTARIALRFGQVVDPDAARRDARHILADRRFKSSPTPRPLRGPLQWIGDRLRGMFEWLGSAVTAVPGAVWIALALVVVGAIAAMVAARLRGRTRTPAPAAPAFSKIDDAVEDPDELERRADDAETSGDLDRAVRLRFRAGLLRLGGRGAIEYRPSVTTGEVRRVLGSATFEELARTFEGIAYGGRTAHPPDAEAARRDWPRVLEETRRR